jgi:hypothetical protein
MPKPAPMPAQISDQIVTGRASVQVLHSAWLTEIWLRSSFFRAWRRLSVCRAETYLGALLTRLALLHSGPQGTGRSQDLELFFWPSNQRFGIIPDLAARSRCYREIVKRLARPPRRPNKFAPGLETLHYGGAELPVQLVQGSNGRSPSGSRSAGRLRKIFRNTLRRADSSYCRAVGYQRVEHRIEWVRRHPATLCPRRCGSNHWRPARTAKSPKPRPPQRFSTPTVGLRVSSLQNPRFRT